MPDEAFFLRVEGHCPICEKDTAYEARAPSLRSHLRCVTCEGDSVPRERAVALTLNEIRPNWRDLTMHECAPIERALHRKLVRECPGYLPTHLFESEPRGAIVRGFRNEDLERQTFADDTFDVVLHIDVFEHIFDPQAATREIYRTLKHGGVMIAAFPMAKGFAGATRQCARRNEDGSIEHLAGPLRYHGNPVDDAGSLVTVDYGYDLYQQLAEWAPFDVRIARYCDKRAGILGDFTDVVVAHKR